MQSGRADLHLDRLGHSLAELLTSRHPLIVWRSAAFNPCKERGITLLSLQERMDTTSAAGELVFHVLEVTAQFERRPIPNGRKMASWPPAFAANGPEHRPLDQDKITAALKLVVAGLLPTAAGDNSAGAIDRLS